MGDVLSYRPSIEERKILDHHNVKWKEFCRHNIYNLGKRDDEFMDKIVIRMILIILGCLVVGLSHLLNDPLLIMFEYIVGISMVFIGSISTVFLWIKQRKDKERIRYE